MSANSTGLLAWPARQVEEARAVGFGVAIPLAYIGSPVSGRETMARGFAIT